MFKFVAAWSLNLKTLERKHSMITFLAIHASPQTLGTKHIGPLSQNLKITPQKTVQQIFKFIAAWPLKNKSKKNIP